MATMTFDEMADKANRAWDILQPALDFAVKVEKAGLTLGPVEDAIDEAMDLMADMLNASETDPDA